MTSYYYPTWADAIGTQWPLFENWGNLGAGNHFIFNSIIECDARNRFSENDTVIVLWTGVARHDVYQFDRWVQNVGLFPKTSKDTILNCPRGYEIQSYAFMKAIDDIMAIKKTKYMPYTWVDYDLDDSIGPVYKDTVSKILRISIPCVPKTYNSTYMTRGQEFWKSRYEKMSGPDWPSFERFLAGEFGPVSDFVKHELTSLEKEMQQDKKWKQMTQTESHPSPLEHLDIAKQILPGFVPDSDCIRWMTDIEAHLVHDRQFDFNRHLPIRL